MEPDFLDLPSHGVVDFPQTRRSLVLRAKDGDADAANELAELYRRPLLTWLRKKGEPNDVAEDIVQVSLQRILVKPAILKRVDFSKGKFRNLVIGVAKNVARERERKDSRQREIDTRRMLDLAQVEDQDSGFHLERARSIATGAAETLRTRHPAEHFVYRLLAEGRSYEDIADIYDREHGHEPRRGRLTRDFIDNRHRRAKEVLQRAILERLWKECATEEEVKDEFNLLKPYLAQVWPFPAPR